MTAQLGLQLQATALARSLVGREARVQQVREWLVDWAMGRWYSTPTDEQIFTGDDIHAALEALGMAEGDTRWSGNVVKGWDAVSPTIHFVPSRRKERHGAPLRVWRFV